MTALDLVSDAIACYRLTRLATKDVITQPARDQVIRRAYELSPDHSGMFVTPRSTAFPDKPVAALLDDGNLGAWQQFAEDDPHPPKIATLVTCRWCSGMYVALLVTSLRILAPRQWKWASRALVAASAAALLARLEDD